MPESHRPRAAALILTLILVVCSPLAVLASGGTLADRLNSVELTPVDPQSEALSELLDQLLDDLVDDEMEPYDQLVACFDYLVDNVSYGSHMARLDTSINGSVSCRSVYNSYGAVEGFGAVALTAGTGLCNAYSAAFILMARKIGYDPYLVTGYTKSGGSWVYHEWAEMVVGDEVLLFDPQLEQSLRAAGLPRYSVFGKTYAESGRFSKA